MKYLLSCFLLFLVGCEGTPLDGMSVTTLDHIVNQGSANIFVVPDSLVPEEIRALGKIYVLAPDEEILPNSPKVDLTPEDTGSWITNALGIVAGVASAWFPKLAALEALFVVLSRRKRDHYKEAVLSALPYDGAVDLKGAAVSIGRALGLAHSSQATKDLVENGDRMSSQKING